MTIEKTSPGKVNLLLNTLGKRPDGFHELETVMHPVQLCDHLTFTRGGNPVQLTCSDPRLPLDAGNLVHRAASAWLQTAGARDGVRIHLEKRVPLAAGLGGGSSNAATTLLGINELFGQPLAPEQLVSLAATLGSDVPFFMQTGPALATGRGEQIQPLGSFPALQNAAFLLMHPGFGIPTAWAYQQLTRFPDRQQGRPGRAQDLVALLQGSDLKAAGAGFFNSLESPAFEKYPILALYQEFLRAQGAAAALMSGSGSTTFAVLPDEAEARRLEEKVRTEFGVPWTTVVPVA